MSRFEISRGRGAISGLPASGWNLTAPDGRTWSASVTTTAGEIGQVRLE